MPFLRRCWSFIVYSISGLVTLQKRKFRGEKNIMYTFNSFVVYSINLNNRLLCFKTLCFNQTLSSSIAATQLLFTLTT